MRWGREGIVWQTQTTAAKETSPNSDHIDKVLLYAMYLSLLYCRGRVFEPNWDILLKRHTKGHLSMVKELLNINENL